MEHDATGHRHDVLTVTEAADRLQVTPDAIRARLRRGTLQGEKQGGAWFVHLEPGETRQDGDATSTGSDTTPAAALVVQLQSEVDYLRGELTAMREQAARERERADVLQREALQRIQALEPGPLITPETPGGPESSQPADHGSTHGGTVDATRATAWARLWRWIRGT